MTETQYRLADGSPRYGIRRNAAPSRKVSSLPGNAGDIGREAARLSLDHLEAAINHRLSSAWADQEDPLLVEFRNEHPEELKAARALVHEHLGSNRSWLRKAQAVRDRRLTSLARRRKASGHAAAAFVLRLVLIAGLLLPSIILVANGAPLLNLVLTGVISLGAAYGAGHAITEWARVPVMPHIRPGWLKELRSDIVDAALLAIVQEKNVQEKNDVDSRTADAAVRGWKHLRFAATTVDILHDGPVI
ncbi:hypothetical protein AB6813_04770 [bacterium RCC_150]